MNFLRVLFLGDIVGQPGRKAVISQLPMLKNLHHADVVIANGENAAGGRGISPKIAEKLFQIPIDVMTTGDHVWDQQSIIDYLPNQPRLLRPINYPPNTVGNGSYVLETPKGKLGVINAQGRTFMRNALENPFLQVEAEITRLKALDINAIFVDFHAETTSEMIAMGRHLDGKASTVVGTHTHVQTADEQVFPNGCAFISDAGMCGVDESILGRSIEPIVQRFLTGMPVSMPVAKGSVRLCGVVVEIDMQTGKAILIERINRVHEET